MSLLVKLGGSIDRVQAMPDRHLTGLYATLALTTALCARIDTTATGIAVVVAFFTAGAIRAVKHPTLADTLSAFMIGLMTGAGVSGITGVLDAAMFSPRTGLLLTRFGGLSFACSSAIISPIVQLISERASAR